MHCVCPVCLEDLTEPASLPCGHTFDLRCIEPVLQLGRGRGQHQACARCPVCREEIPFGLRLRQNHLLRDLLESRCGKVDPAGDAVRVPSRESACDQPRSGGHSWPEATTALEVEGAEGPAWGGTRLFPWESEDPFDGTFVGGAPMAADEGFTGRAELAGMAEVVLGAETWLAETWLPTMLEFGYVYDVSHRAWFLVGRDPCGDIVAY